MKNIALMFVAFVITKEDLAQYKSVNNKSSVHFKVKTFGINVNGAFDVFDANILFDPDHLNDSKFDVSIDANSINTDNSLRDEHLRENPFFDVKKFPNIRFVSTRIVPSTKKGTLILYGKLSIKDQTKDISFPFTAEESPNSYLFEGALSINRKDFHVGETNIISDNVEISLNVFATKENSSTSF
jgi:polyisoprenoid-binding protein YceI